MDRVYIGLIVLVLLFVLGSAIFMCGRDDPPYRMVNIGFSLMVGVPVLLLLFWAIIFATGAFAQEAWHNPANGVYKPLTAEEAAEMKRKNAEVIAQQKVGLDRMPIGQVPLREKMFPNHKPELPYHNIPLPGEAQGCLLEIQALCPPPGMVHNH